jgi:hypothetical protein
MVDAQSGLDADRNYFSNRKYRKGIVRPGAED